MQFSCSKENQSPEISPKVNNEIQTKKMVIQNNEGNSIEVEVRSKGNVDQIMADDFVLITDSEKRSANKKHEFENPEEKIEDKMEFDVIIQITRLNFKQDVVGFNLIPNNADVTAKLRWRCCQSLGFSVPGSMIWGFDTGRYTDSDNSCSVEYVVNKLTSSNGIGQELVRGHLYDDNDRHIVALIPSNLNYVFRWDEDGYGCIQTEVFLAPEIGGGIFGSAVRPDLGMRWLVQ